MTEYEQRMLAAVERIATAAEALAAEPERRREHERAESAQAVEAIRMRQAVEGVAVEVDAPKPAVERVEAVREIARGALKATQ